MHEASSLAADLLTGVAAISTYLYGDASPSNVRRARNLIDRGVIPTKKLFGRVESRRSWIDQVYAEPDQPNGGAEK
jgi:hypothetical protein